MKVLLLSRYGPLGASSRVRSYQYLPYLKAHGVYVTVSPLLDDDYLRQLYSGKVNHLRAGIGPYFRRSIELLKARQFDLMWIEKELFPWLPSLGEMIIACLGIPYIVDYDDAVFHRYDAHSNMLIRKLLGNKIDAVMRRAAIVIAGNEYLMERAKCAGARRVEYLPTVVDLERYAVRYNVKNTKFTIGWIGSPATVKYLELIRPVLSEWDKKDISRLVIVGAASFKLDGMSVEHHAWYQDSGVSEIQRFDVGIMPLPDNLWEKGKCGYKLIQYMACGKPVIASPVGINSKIVEHGINGFLASTAADWVSALNTLRNDPKLRARMGRKGRKKVEREYCVQVTASRLAALLLSVAE